VSDAYLAAVIELLRAYEAGSIPDDAFEDRFDELYDESGGGQPEGIDLILANLYLDVDALSTDPDLFAELVITHPELKQRVRRALELPSEHSNQ
jgi:hypothetical protein